MKVCDAIEVYTVLSNVSLKNCQEKVYKNGNTYTICQRDAYGLGGSV